MLRTKGIGAAVRNSIEDLAGWASVERPDLARLAADGNVVIVFSDIEGSTERNEGLGDREWVKLLQRHEHLVRSSVDEHHGHVVKNQGDGFMLAFADPDAALRCCVDVQHPERWQNIKVPVLLGA
jgi:class 3 adenylate cyclase